MNARFSGKEIADFCHFLAREYGLCFAPTRYSFVENRIGPLLNAFCCQTPAELLHKAKTDLALRVELLNTLTTNETWFFRHPQHFLILKNHVLRELVEYKRKIDNKQISIWSAGCSTGAETYSLLFAVLDCINPAEFNIQITGSDISSDALKTARIACYNKHDLRITGQEVLHKYFIEKPDDTWQIKQEILKYTKFELLNLLKSWPARTFDIIFCRNTMIYFDNASKTSLTQRFLSALNPGGYFFTSANETIHMNDDADLKKLFIENEIIYQRSSVKIEYQVLKFATPSDLLRALNLLQNHGFEYHLEKIHQAHNLAPTRAIYLNRRDIDKVKELFALNAIKLGNSVTAGQ